MTVMITMWSLRIRVHTVTVRPQVGLQQLQLFWRRILLLQTPYDSG